MLFLIVWAGVIVVFFSLSNSKLVPYVLPAMMPLALLFSRGTTCSSSKVGLPMIAAHLLFVLVSGALLLANLGLIDTGANTSGTPGAAGLCLVAIFLAIWNLVLLLRTPRGVGINRSLLAAGCLCLAILWSGSRLAESLTSKQIAGCLNSLGASQAEIYSFDGLAQSLPFYLDRRIGIVGYLGEIEFGVGRLPEVERQGRFPTVEEFLPRWQSATPMYLVLQHGSADKATAQGLLGESVCESPRYQVLRNQFSVVAANSARP